MTPFEKDIKDLTPVTIDHAEQTISKGESAVYFIGRGTCPYCRKFATKLANVVADTDAAVYFVNSEQADQLDQLSQFRGQYGIPTVPGFVRVLDGQVTVRCDSGMTEAEIKTFMGA
ncbi:thioredoxin [Streptococcus moroccensis]|uniref:Bacteriocin transport accessory protein n=1 Tax=Streptococcus moroccensis TaxID=1451356 RepID=A0ABT9YU98_9STRE|nr:thioredoxin [Streptococcus moroccensis]MDQ0223558.1 putative bacteriocin transport accessory protein [Streptococcus moroccensis]